MTAFPSIRIEGGIFGPDVLDQLLAADLPGQRPSDFGREGRRGLTEEIAAIFADARALWGVFQNRLNRLPENDIATTVTRDAWMVPFLGLLGYEMSYNSRAYDVDGLSFAISHRAGESENAPPVHIVGARQELGRVAASGRPRLAPHSMVQEFLNRTEHLWGFVSNGLTLRVLRDCTFVRRQAYIEFDLAAIFEEQRFQDFSALFRLLHRTRLPRGLNDADICLLEQYYNHSLEQGGRVREHLREGVEECIRLLANGFLRHHDSQELCQRVASDYAEKDRISAMDLYRQLLRLVYRLLFLLVSEDRGILSTDPLYREHYGIDRLRRLLEQRAAWTEHDDLWQSLRVLWKVFSDDKLAPFLHLAPLNGELFTPLALDRYSISNRDLLEAFWYLAWYQDHPSAPPRRVNYAALDVEEFGSVYESLLELHPQFLPPWSAPSFDLLREGRDRRSTGSHYTPHELVVPLIQHALEPVLAERLADATTSKQKECAILSLKVCDMACGSGHFLLAAARRLGRELARVKTGEDEPAPERVREAIREVMTHCIYGVDKNPLVVELCRVALWLESNAEGKPLTFLDHRIRCGDSLVGVFDLEALEHGVPDEAFKPVAGDDGAVARATKRINAATRQDPLSRYACSEKLKSFADRLRALDALPEDTIDQVRAKAATYGRIEQSLDFERLRLACNAWTAAFFQPFPNPSGSPVTTETVAVALGGGQIPDARLAGFVTRTAIEQRFFHWLLAFPEVFASGGFDVVLGNPPFMGGLKISTNMGDRYWRFITHQFSPFFSTADICAAFFRQAFSSLADHGAFALIGTNTIGQGDTRKAGLAEIKRVRGKLSFVKRYVKWPGRANVEVNLVAAGKQRNDSPELDDQSVEEISSRLDLEPEIEPLPLLQNKAKSFIGSFVHGKGFLLEPKEAINLIRIDPRYRDCLFPYLNGQDLNSQPDQQPTRWTINFFDWPLERAEKYTDLIHIVRNKVKPERDLVKRDRNRLRWWIYAENRPGLYSTVKPLKHILVRSEVSENLYCPLFPKVGFIHT